MTAIDEKDESKYTVEVTGGEFYMGETVDIYRNSEYETASRIGRGTVGRTQAVAVNGNGKAFCASMSSRAIRSSAANCCLKP